MAGGLQWGKAVMARNIRLLLVLVFLGLMGVVRGLAEDRTYTLDFQVPGDHAVFTVVVDDETGRRVRNLLGEARVSEHALAEAYAGKESVRVRVVWDGLDDEGHPVPPGRYQARGLSLPELRASFDFAWYGPGDPAWVGYPNSGWGGDHVGPTRIVPLPETEGSDWLVAISGPQCEGGDGIFALNGEYRKVFGYRRAGAGAMTSAVHAHMLYLVLWEVDSLIRIDSRSGRLVPWQRRAGMLQEIRLEGQAWSMAVGGGQMAILFFEETAGRGYRIEYRDVETASLLDTQYVPHRGHLGADPDGMIYLSDADGFWMVGAGDLRVPVPLREIGEPGAFFFDGNGNLLMMDMGPDHQVKVLDPSYRLLQRIGTRGGQGDRLRFDRHAHQYSVTSIARDRNGRIWTVEAGHPRRQVLWSEDGRAAERQFVGTTQYGGSGTALHDQDPRLAVAYGTLFAVDNRHVQRYAPLAYMAGPRKDHAVFGLQRRANGFVRAQIFRSDASGTMREYAMMPEDHGYVLYQRNEASDYRPVAALMPAHMWPGPGVPGGLDSPVPGGMFLWSDLNGDERIQAEELQHIPESETVGQAWLRLIGGWTYPMHPDLAFFVNGRILNPVSFTRAGAPVYDVASAPRFRDHEEITTVFSQFHRVGNHLYGVENDAQPFHGRHVWTDMSGRIVATFAFDAQALHGAMQKGVPGAGETSGEQFISGIADMGGEIGSLMAFQANYGQAFLFSEDGLYVSRLFRDARTPHDGWGATMEKGLDWTNITMEQEPFGGWFGRQDDGVVRYQFGRNECVVAQVHGLERIVRFRVEEPIRVGL